MTDILNTSPYPLGNCSINSCISFSANKDSGDNAAPFSNSSSVVSEKGTNGIFCFCAKCFKATFLVIAATHSPNFEASRSWEREKFLLSIRATNLIIEHLAVNRKTDSQRKLAYILSVRAHVKNHRSCACTFLDNGHGLGQLYHFNHYFCSTYLCFTEILRCEAYIHKTLYIMTRSCLMKAGMHKVIIYSGAISSSSVAEW